MNLIITFVLTFLTLQKTPPIIIKHTNNPNKHEIHSSDFDNTIRIELKDATGLTVFEGTLIHENWILTAAHGLNSVEANQYISIFGDTVLVTDIIIHPHWDGEIHDIALIKLNTAITLPQKIVISGERDEEGSEIILVGHGMYGTGQSGPIIDDGKFRIATNIIDDVNQHYINFRFDEPDHPNSTELEGISGPGDSGGPAFRKTENGLELVGISSHQDNTVLALKEGHYGVIEYYTRVSSYIGWIMGIIEDRIEIEKLEEKVESQNWIIGEGQLSERVSDIMEALCNGSIMPRLVESNFTDSFQKSTDIVGFLNTVSGFLENPTLLEIKKAKSHLLSFTISNTNGKTYYFQFDADKRNEYLISGLTVKKTN